MKVMSVFGTRPEAIKMAPLVKKLNADPDIESVLCVTAQHREMLDQVLELFELKPDYDLNIMKPNQTLAMITANVLTGMEDVLIKERPADASFPKYSVTYRLFMRFVRSFCGVAA